MFRGGCYFLFVQVKVGRYSAKLSKACVSVERKREIRALGLGQGFSLNLGGGVD